MIIIKSVPPSGGTDFPYLRKHYFQSFIRRKKERI